MLHVFAWQAQDGSMERAQAMFGNGFTHYKGSIRNDMERSTALLE